MVKLPAQFKGIFKPGEALSKAHGKALAEWAGGGVKASPAEPAPAPAPKPNIKPVPAKEGQTEIQKFTALLLGVKSIDELKAAWSIIPPDLKPGLESLKNTRKDALK